MKISVVVNWQIVIFGLMELHLFTAEINLGHAVHLMKIFFILKKINMKLAGRYNLVKL